MGQTPLDRTPQPSRYGPAPMPAATRHRIVRALGGLTVLLGLALAVAGYLRFEGTEVEGTGGAYEVLDDHTVSVTISVKRKDPATPVVCIVRAKARDATETGRREVVVGPSTNRIVEVTTTVKSYRTPFAADVYGCGSDIPGYLTAP